MPAGPGCRVKLMSDVGDLDEGEWVTIVSWPEDDESMALVEGEDGLQVWIEASELDGSADEAEADPESETMWAVFSNDYAVEGVQADHFYVQDGFIFFGNDEDEVVVAAFRKDVVHHIKVVPAPG